MGKNYSKFSKYRKEQNNRMFALGIVNCERLFLREKDSKESKPITVLEENTKLKIALNDTDKNNEFYKVTTSAGIEGYCMKKFITIK